MEQVVLIVENTLFFLIGMCLPMKERIYMNSFLFIVQNSLGRLLLNR
jgi:hypothetical protein